VALNWAVHLAKKGYSVLIVSTDTDYSDQAIRVASLVFGVSMEEVEKHQEYYAVLLEGLHLPIRWSELHLDAEDVADFVKAEVEFLGERPDFIVVDVVGDMLNGKEENVGNIRNIFTQLKKVARRFHTTIFALHHVKRGSAASGTSVVTLSDGLYGGEQVAPIVLGMWRNQDMLTVAVLKNRMGKAQADGLLNFDLRTDYSHARVSSGRVIAW
jgi:KaiC/GvpD/RAD55 family RecA-like ATPase